MPLDEYVIYIHQLALGEAGDYSKLPNYTPEQELALKQADFKHFQDELVLGHYDRNLYIQDAQGNIVINPNAPTLPNIDNMNEFITDTFEPAYLTQARHEYSNMVHNLNEHNQAEVDDYNADVRRQLSVFGANYDEMVEGQNDYIARHALSTTSLLVFDQSKYLSQYLLDYNPLKDTFPTAGSSGASGGTITTADGKPIAKPFLPITNDDNGSVLDAKKQLEIEAARRNGLTRDQYLESKRILQAELGEGEFATDKQTKEVIDRIKGRNVETIEGDTDTIYTSEGKIIRRVVKGIDTTDQTVIKDLADPLNNNNATNLVSKPQNAGIDPQNVPAVASAQNQAQNRPTTSKSGK